MCAFSLDELDAWKSRFGVDDLQPLEALLTAAAGWRTTIAAEIIRLHETVLFLRAYPASRKVARLADAVLFAFGRRIREFADAGGDLSAFEEPAISGIVGTSLSAVFSYDVAVHLAAALPRAVEIAWDRHDEIERLGYLLPRLLPMFAEDWPVEAHAPFREWIAAARSPRQTDIAWLLDRLAALPVGPRERAALYDNLRLPLTWEIGNQKNSRSRLRLPRRSLFVHREPLLRRSDVSLTAEMEAASIPVRRLPRAEARGLLDVILETSAMRFRELYGFSHPDEANVFHADLGRGIDLYFFGVPPEWRLPLRAYHGGMFFKNGVPAGYVELLSLFERAEIGFNLYYTFREGESAWLYARLLHLFHQVLGVTCFSVDPYQIGHENPEAVESGAFWFYRKLGFRPVDPEVVRLVAREEERLRGRPGYRSSKATLEKLANGYILYETPTADRGAWDGFRARNAAIALQRRDLPAECGIEAIPNSGWTAEEKAAAARIVRTKRMGSETQYLRLMQGHLRLRAAFLKLGNAG